MLAGSVGMVVVVVLHGVRAVVGPDQAQDLRPLPRVAVLPRLALGQPLPRRRGLQSYYGSILLLLLLLLLLVMLLLLLLMMIMLLML